MTTTPKKEALVILDFDGTLYRGSCPQVFRGIANVDLLLMLCLGRMTKPRPFFRLVNSGIRLLVFERRIRRAYLNNQTTLSEADEQLVRFFEAHVLSQCQRTEINRAVSAVSRRCYRSAWRCFCGIKDRCDFVVVSKSFTFLLEQVCRRAKAYGLELACYGNTFDGESVYEDESIVTREDKHDCVKALLAGQTYRRVAVIGDTEDDIVMRDAAAAAIGPASVAFICLHAKDARAAAAADKVCRSWQSADVFLNEWLDGKRSAETNEA